MRLRAGRPRAALEDSRAELEIRRALGTVFGIGLSHLQLAQALARVGSLEEAIGAAREAVRLSSIPDDCALLAEAHRVLGLLLLRHDRDGKEGDRALAQALAIAREQEALSLELRAAMAIARGPRPDPAPLAERVRALLRGLRHGRSDGGEGDPRLRGGGDRAVGELTQMADPRQRTDTAAGRSGTAAFRGGARFREMASLVDAAIAG